MARAQAPLSRGRRALVGLALAVVVGAGVLVAAAGLWFRDAVYGESGLPTHRTPVVIPRGTSFSGVVAILRRENVIAHPLAFRLLARLRRVDAEVKAGEYAFPPHQSSDQVLERLVRGEQIALWVTIPEGFTAKQIARTLAQRNLGSERDYERIFLQRPLAIGDLRAPDKEGYLYPSTYLIPVDDRPEAVARILVDQFRKELPRDAAARARSLGRTVPEVVTIASLVEREGKVDDERPLIASVIYNRLRQGMPLEVDASIEYAFAEHHDVITRRDLQTDSPYNTYRHAGLPPTPIANPGKPSLDAAFFPARTDFLYYVAKGDGHHAFAKSLAEHNANVARYLK